MKNTLPVCVIGAGPSGLVTAKALKEHQIPFFVLEKHSDTGGIWDMNNEGSPMYEAAHFISSKTLSGFPGHPMPDEYPDYPNQEQILKYIRSFAEKEGLYEYIRFNTPVEKVNKLDEEEWEIVAGGKTFLASAVVVATGPLWHPNIPELKGSFSGIIRHSSTFKKSEEFTGKRVLLVGGGNSGVDIACEAATFAKEAHLSLRRGYHFLPKHILGVPADVFAHGGPKIPMWIQQKVFGWLLKIVVGDQTKYGLPKPDHKLFESHPLLNTQVIHHVTHGNLKVHRDIDHLDGNTVYFTDGEKIEVDEIVLATGYHMHIPFASSYFDWKNNRPMLSLAVFNPKEDNIFAMGFIETNSAAYTLLSQLAELVALYIKDKDSRPEIARKFRAKMVEQPVDISGGIHFVDSPRHTGYVEADAIQKSIKKAKKMLA